MDNTNDNKNLIILGNALKIPIEAIKNLVEDFNYHEGEDSSIIVSNQEGTLQLCTHCPVIANLFADTLQQKNMF